MISAERLMPEELRALREMAGSTAIKGPLLITLLDEIEAARTRIAELEEARAADGRRYLMEVGEKCLEINRLRAHGLSQEDRDALEQIDLLAFGGTDDTNPEKERCKQIHSLSAAILRRLGGQTT